MTRLTLTDTLRQAIDMLRTEAHGRTHRRNYGGRAYPACIPDKCEKCRLLALADECERHADLTERQELAQ